jgi:hypothetical protein
VRTDLNKEAPNVVTETQFRVLLQQGYQAEVVCKTPAFRKNAVWYGEWFIRAVTEDRSVEKLRLFKTANGLISFLEGFGFDPIHIPLRKGGRALHVLPNGNTLSDDD